MTKNKQLQILLRMQYGVLQIYLFLLMLLTKAKFFKYVGGISEIRGI